MTTLPDKVTEGASLLINLGEYDIYYVLNPEERNSILSFIINADRYKIDYNGSIKYVPQTKDISLKRVTNHALNKAKLDFYVGDTNDSE